MNDLRDLRDKVILITGATSGLGRHLAGDLAPSGARLVLHGRDPAKVEALRRELSEADGAVPVRPVVADLADLRQVDRLADELTGSLDRLDVLVSNAGIGFGPPGATRETSAQGLELRFAVNYLAGYHLTRRLLPLLTASTPARIVNVASIGQEPLDRDDPLTERRYSGSVAYRRSKLAQIMSTIDLAAELAEAGVDVTVNALHPATFMDTAMVHEGGVEPLSTVAQGADATLRLIASPDLDGVTGRFFDGTRPARPQAQADDPDVRAWLRDLSDHLITTALTPDADRS
jgi:NAD(P)-dependent dehydrogenase (short-subunit alcohol dehydrogenase family)